MRGYFVFLFILIITFIVFLSFYFITYTHAQTLLSPIPKQDIVNDCDSDNAICSPTPTLDCDGDYNNSGHNNDGECISPTPTQTQVSTVSIQVNPTPSLVSNSDGTGGGNQPGSPTCNFVLKPALLQGAKRISPTQVQFQWWLSTDLIDKQSIIYGYEGNSLIYSAVDLPANITSYTINDLLSNNIVWAKIISYKGGCVSYSEVLDP